MAYDTGNPPALITQRVGDDGPNSVWWYVSTDPVSTVRANGYFTNGHKLGMRKGDIIFVTDSDSSPIATQICSVVESTAASTASGDDVVDLSDGVAITATDSD